MTPTSNNQRQVAHPSTLPCRAVKLPAEIIGLTLVPVNVTRGAVERVLIVARDCEVVDTRIQYYDHPVVDPEAWNRRLGELGIIVRPGVFPPVRWLPAGARLDFLDGGGGAHRSLMPQARPRTT